MSTAAAKKLLGSSLPSSSCSPRWALLTGPVVFPMASLQSGGWGVSHHVSHWLSHKQKQPLFFIFHGHNFIKVFFSCGKFLFWWNHHFSEKYVNYFYALLNIPEETDLKKEWVKKYTTEGRVFPVEKTKNNIWINLVANSSSKTMEVHHALICTCNTQRQGNTVWIK